MPHPVPAVSHVAALTGTYLPHLRPAQQRGLALWVAGVLAAESGCEQAVLGRLETLGLPAHATRASLREWLYDGADRAAPCATGLDVEGCFAPLLGWVLDWWEGDTLPLAVDATSLRDRQVVLAVSVLYRGSAIPVAWAVLPHRGKGAWLPHLERLLGLLAPAVPPTLTVLVMTDRGLWSPRLWRQIKENGWHPLMRVRPDATFAPTGQRRQRARELVPGAGWYWVGEGVLQAQGQASGGHVARRLGTGPGRAVAAADRPGTRRGRGQLVRAARLDRTRLPRAQVDGLALGADAAHRPGAHRPPLAGAGRRHLAQPGRGHPPGGCRAARAAAGAAAASPRPPPTPGAGTGPQRVCPRVGLVARPGAAGQALVARVVAAAGTVAGAVPEPGRHPSRHHSRRCPCLIPPPLSRLDGRGGQGGEGRPRRGEAVARIPSEPSGMLPAHHRALTELSSITIILDNYRINRSLAMDDTRLEQLSLLFKALADPARLRILGLLAEQPHAGHELAERLALTPPTISHHMRRLVAAGLVDVSPDAQSRIYSLRTAALRELARNTNEAVVDDAEHGEDAAVIRAFFDGPRLKHLPAARKKRVVVLRKLLERFEPGRTYPEREVNDLLRVAHDDVASLRRELVDYGFLVRDRGIYRIASELPARGATVRQEVGDEAKWFQDLVARATERAVQAKSAIRETPPAPRE